MLAFLGPQLATVVVALLVFVPVLWIVVRGVRRRQKNKEGDDSCAGCACSCGCPACAGASSKQNAKT